MKKSKKFLLAWLVLLAITMVLLPLAGCKNDSVSPEVEKQEQGDGGGSETDKNNTAAKLVSISVTTPPARTVYSVGQEFDRTGMVVTATYEGGEKCEVTGWTTNFDTVAAGKGLDKEVIVSYTEGETPKTTTFTVTVFPAEVKVLTGYTSPNNTDDSWTYVEFGEWPQTIKEEGVEIGFGTLVRGGLTYHVGSDGNYYVKITAKPYEDTYTYTYSDGNLVEKDKEVYFKVEPIVWRVLTTNYTAPPEGGTVGEILLLAESILTGGIPYYHFDREGGLDGKEWSGSRIIGNKTIHPNNYEHSQIRAWLNGLSYQSKESEGATQSSKDEYKNAGFLQTAFTQSARNLIADTTVDNSVTSTFGTGENTLDNPYACGNTTDKVFLLSEEEATNSEYGFGAYSEKDSARIRVTTDYAKATGVNQSSTPGYGGWWWLRSPIYLFESLARGIDYYGYAIYNDIVDFSNGGVVPALSISLKSN